MFPPLGSIKEVNWSFLPKNNSSGTASSVIKGLIEEKGSVILKKVFNCRKCKAELGLFLDENNNDNLFWMDLLQCEDAYHKNLIDLQKNKDKCKGNNKKYNQIIKEISTIQNQIRLDKAKLKVKYKIKNLAMFI